MNEKLYALDDGDGTCCPDIDEVISDHISVRILDVENCDWEYVEEAK